MRRAILVKFIRVLLAALVLNSLIFYLVTSSVMIRNIQRDLRYTLEVMDGTIDYSQELMNQVKHLNQISGKYQGNVSIIKPSVDENALSPEMIEARDYGHGYHRQGRVLSVAIRSAYSDFVLHVSVPYSGMFEYLVMLFPAVCLSFVVALIYSIFSADQLAGSIAKPLHQISKEMLKGSDYQSQMFFETYPYEEINIIAETTTKLSQSVQENLEKLEMEKKIRQTFFSNASHELKTPITSIQGYAELLENNLAKSDEQRMDFIHRIKKESISMSDLINDILTISKLESHDIEISKMDVRVAVVLEDILDGVKPIADLQNITIHSEWIPITIFANQQQIKELLGNLLINAIKYNKPYGEVWVKLSKEDGCLVISVKDSGVGIPKESINRVFERFYRVDKGRSKKQGGTGLGLSIVKHIVQFYHGSIDVYSNVDIGTEFVVKLPLSFEEKVAF